MVIEYQGKRYSVVGQTDTHYICTEPLEEEFGQSFFISKKGGACLINFIKELRGNMSLREMERITGLSHTYLSTLEKGFDPRSKKEHKPTPDALRKIVNAFNVSYIELMIRVG